MNERAIRVTHGIIFFIVFLVGIVTLGISGYLVRFSGVSGVVP